MNIVLDSLMIHPALAVEFLIVLDCIIELRPYGNHEAAIHRMYAVEHRLWVRITCRLKLMTSPRIQFPVVPVLNDIVYRNLQVAELLQVLLDVLAALIALTALPETESPLRIERSLAGKRTVARNHLVEVLTGNEVVIHVRRHFAPDAQLVLLCL